MTASLIAYLVSMMTAWVPIQSHSYYEPTVATAARYDSIARDVLDAATESPMFAGSYGAAKTAALSLSIAGAESHYAKRTDECRPGPGEGDRDKAGVPHAWTLWQMHDEPGRVHHWLTCSSRVYAARASLAWIAESFSRCRYLEMGDRLSFYTDGACRKDWKRSRFRVERATAYVKAHPLPVEEKLAEASP